MEWQGRSRGRWGADGIAQRNPLASASSPSISRIFALILVVSLVSASFLFLDYWADHSSSERQPHELPSMQMKEQQATEHAEICKPCVPCTDDVRNVSSGCSKEHGPLDEEKQEHTNRYLRTIVPRSMNRCDGNLGFAHAASYKRSILCHPSDRTPKTRNWRTEIDSYSDDGWMFVVARDLVVDFSKATVDPIDSWNEREEAVSDFYHHFPWGTARGNCRMKGGRNWRGGVIENFLASLDADDELEFDEKCDGKKNGSVVIEHPVIMLQRWHTHNMWHTFHDIFNVFLMLVSLDMGVEDILVAVIDPMPLDFFIDFWKLAFSPNHNIMRVSDFRKSGPKYCFRKTLFPAGGASSPWSVMFWDSGKVCRGMPVFKQLSQHILQSMNMVDTYPNEKKVVITYIARRNSDAYPDRKIGRQIENEEDIVALLESFAVNGKVEVRVLDYAVMPLREQVRNTRETNVFVGVHGAGMTHLLFLTDNAIVIELQMTNQKAENPNCFLSLAKARGLLFRRVYASETATGNAMMKFHEKELEELRRFVAAAILMTTVEPNAR